LILNNAVPTTHFKHYMWFENDHEWRELHSSGL